jgi:hypothetical protein
MSKNTARLIRDSWLGSFPFRRTTALNVYARLFEIDPTAKALFNGKPMHVQHEKSCRPSRGYDSPSMVPSGRTFMRSAAGDFDNPGIVMMSPHVATTNEDRNFNRGGRSTGPGPLPRAHR